MNTRFGAATWIVIGKGKGWAAFNRLTSQTEAVRDTQKQARKDAERLNRVERAKRP